MRDFNRRQKFDRTRKQSSDKKDYQQPSIGIEPPELLFHGAEHFIKLRPMNAEEQGHGITEDPVHGFQYTAWLHKDSMTFKMQNYSCDKCECKGYDQCNANIRLVFHLR